MIKWLNSLSWSKLSVILAALFIFVLFVGGQFFVALGFTPQHITWKDAAWPPFAVGALVYIGCSLMPILMPPEDNATHRLDSFGEVIAEDKSGQHSSYKPGLA